MDHLQVTEGVAGTALKRFGLVGKTALVTGGTKVCAASFALSLTFVMWGIKAITDKHSCCHQGIGKAVVEELAALGAKASPACLSCAWLLAVLAWVCETLCSP